MRSRLLERDAELAACAAALRDGAGGRGGLVLVEGAPGAGKTRLLATATADARAAGMRVLAARAAEGERAFAFGVVRQLLGPVLARANEADRARLLSGPAAPAAPALDPTAGPTDAGDGPLHGLFWLVVALAAQAPLAVVVDDLHWADDASRTLLAFLGRRVDGLALTLLLAARPLEPGAPPGVLDELAGEPSAHRLRPRALSPDAVGVLVRDRLGAADPAFVDACHRASAGNPFLVGELLGELEAERVAPTVDAAAAVARLRPEGVMRALAGRIARLDPDAAALAQALAILGDDADRDGLAAFAGLTPDEGDRRAAELTRLGLLATTTGDRLAFAHPLLRAAVRERLTRDERAARHARAAALLAADPATRERAALHLLEVPPRGDATAFAVLQEAGVQAIDRGAPAAAALLLRRAVAEPPPAARAGEAHLALGLALARTGDVAAALPILDTARERATAAPQLVDAAMLVARLRLQRGDRHAALAALDRARASLDDDEEVLDIRLRAERLVTLRGASQAIDPHELEELETLAARAGRDEQRKIAGVRAVEEIASGGSAARAVAAATVAVAGPPPRGERDAAHLWAGATLVLADAFELGEAHFTRELDDADRRGASFERAIACCWRGIARQRRGDLAGAEADCRAALDAGLDMWMGGPGACGSLIEVHLAHGDLDAAHATSARADLLLGGEDMPDDFLLTARAKLALAEGRTQDALTMAQLSREHLRGTPLVGPGSFLWPPVAVAALLALERPDEARALAAADLVAARAFGAPWRTGLALHAAALVAPDPDERRALLEDAVAHHARAGVRLERARALHDLGRALVATGEREPARAAMVEGLTLADHCGATVLAAELRAALVATGARPRRAHHSGPLALTAAERRSANLAAAGRPNAEIAAALFVTTKTVEKHLSAAYRKLGVGSRSQLGAALADDATA